jgi:hypothetical protein
LAGPAAEIVYSFGRCNTPFEFSDSDNLTAPYVWRAVSLAGQIDGRGSSIFSSVWKNVQDYLSVDENWSAVTAVAETLVRDGELTGAEIALIVNTVTSR